MGKEGSYHPHDWNKTYALKPEVRVVVTSGGRSDRRGTREPAGVLGRCHILLWVMITWANKRLKMA